MLAPDGLNIYMMGYAQGAGVLAASREVVAQ